ncbi:hypothetical protein BH20ACT13_BH20ACT13_10750 [soil metagenome]
MSHPVQPEQEVGRSTAKFYADVPNRVVALLVDAVLLTLLIFAGTVIVALVVGPAVEFDPAAENVGEAVTIQRGVAVVDALLNLMLSAAYFVGSWRFLGGSPGQRWLGMTVVDDRGGDRVSARRALARWALLGAPFGAGALLTAAVASSAVALAVNVAVAVWYFVLLVTVARSPTRQGVHDRVAHTVVAKEARQVPWSGRTVDAR